MTTRYLVLSLLATIALGGTFALPAMSEVLPAITETPLPASQAQPTQLDAVATAATRMTRPIDEVTSTVSIITNEDIDRDNMQDLRDLVRTEPGVAVGNPNARTGFTHATLARARRRIESGRGVLAVLHDLTMAAYYAHRVATMECGRLTALGPPATTLDPALLSQIFATPIRRLHAGATMAFASPGGMTPNRT
jgi:hypothetical protein